MESKSYVVAIDLGSSKVRIVVGEVCPEGVRVAALAERQCQGVKAGLVENSELVAQAVSEAKQEIRERIGVLVTEAYVGISGRFVRCASHKDYVFTNDKLSGVSQADVDHLFDRMRNVQAPDSETILERIAQNYIIDNNSEVSNPVGSFSSKLSATFNFILCEKTPMQRLDLALRRCGITIKGYFSNAQAVVESVLNSEDREEGAVVVNIGCDLTDIAIVHRNVLRYITTIPIAGSAINADIRTQSIADKYVEPLKCNYGSAVADMTPNTNIEIPSRTTRDKRRLPRHNLAVIIEARVRDIIDFVQQELQGAGYAKKINYLVLTGGTSMLKNIEQLFAVVTGMEVRCGEPIEGIHPDSFDAVNYVDYATVMGLLLKGAKLGACATPIDEEWVRRNEAAQAALKAEQEREEQERKAAQERQLAEQARQKAEQIRRAEEELRRLRGEGVAVQTPKASEPPKVEETVAVQPIQPEQPKVIQTPPTTQTPQPPKVEEPKGEEEQKQETNRAVEPENPRRRGFRSWLKKIGDELTKPVEDDDDTII